MVTARAGDALLQARLGTLASGSPVSTPCGRGSLALQPGTGGLTSLGTKQTRLEWTDPLSEPAWYYARAFVVDGEMAWSSPIWIGQA